jgi:F-type H+-transporting ATPase subunit epsilon
MADPTFQLSVITPDHAVLETAARFCAFPAHDGEIGIEANRAPLLVKLGVGWLRAETADGTHRFLVDGGFAQMVDNRLSVLTEHAQRPDEIDPQAAKTALAAAQAMPSGDEIEFAARQRALAHARAALKPAR